MPTRRRLAAGSLALAVLSVACSGSSASDGRVKVVASFYPLAWAAQHVGGGGADVEDLTPPGTEAHDTTLTAAQRGELQTAGVVLYLGQLGFQPDVERAVADAQGMVVAVTQGLDLLGSSQQGLSADPHVWLDPVLMEQIVRRVADALAAADPVHADGYRRRGDGVLGTLRALDAGYRSGLSGCGFSTFVTTHEAFGYLAARYGLQQLGIEGLTPQSEPSADRIQAATQAIRDGRAAPAIFFESTDEGRRIGRSVAADVGVPALPLGTLESAPPAGDYASVMRDNLSNLEEGLRCGA